MKVILLQEVRGLGKAGAVKEVRNGYGINYLLPKGLAELATEAALKRAEGLLAKRAKETEIMAADAKAKAAEIAGKTVMIKAKAEDGKLFGSIGREEIADALKGLANVGKEMLIVKKPFKEIGKFPVEADFGHGIKASFEVVIEAE